MIHVCAWDDGNWNAFCYQQGTICLESGSYLKNYAGCKGCGKREPLKTLEMSTQEDNDGEELVTYKRM